MTSGKAPQRWSRPAIQMCSGSCGTLVLVIRRCTSKPSGTWGYTHSQPIQHNTAINFWKYMLPFLIARHYHLLINPRYPAAEPDEPSDAVSPYQVREPVPDLWRSVPSTPPPFHLNPCVFSHQVERVPNPTDAAHFQLYIVNDLGDHKPESTPATTRPSCCARFHRCLSWNLQ